MISSSISKPSGVVSYAIFVTLSVSDVIALRIIVAISIVAILLEVLSVGSFSNLFRIPIELYMLNLGNT